MHGSAHYHRPLVGWLSLAQLISWGSVFYLFALVMAPIESELRVSRAQASLAFSIALLIDGLVAYPVGRLIDRGHERAVMTGGSCVVALGLALHSQVTSLGALYAVWALLGLGMGATLYAPVFSVVTRRFPQDFRRAIITMTFLGGLASTVFIPLTAWLIAQMGWRQALWVLGGFNLLVCAPLHWHWLRHAPRRPAAHPQDAIGPHAAAAADPGLRHHLQSAPYLLIGLAIVCMTFATAALPSHMINLLREYGLAEHWVLLVPASIGVLQVLGRLLLYLFESRFDVHLANRLIPCLMPVGLALLLVAPWLGAPQSSVVLATLLFFVVTWGMGNGMLTIVKGTAMAQYVSHRHVASLNGAMGVPLALVRASAPLALALMWSAQSGYRWGLAAMISTGVAGALALAVAQGLALKRARH
ncbi:MAG: hypothetical protein RLZZ126_475 [Pseudomonadota bacterium]|jgi:MFS family permease